MIVIISLFCNSKVIMKYFYTCRNKEMWLKTVLFSVAVLSAATMTEGHKWSGNPWWNSYWWQREYNLLFLYILILSYHRPNLIMQNLLKLITQIDLSIVLLISDFIFLLKIYIDYFSTGAIINNPYIAKENNLVLLQ